MKDHNFVPSQRSQCASALEVSVERLEELTEDSPLVIFLCIVVQQVFSFPWYLAVNITASQGSSNKKQSKVPFTNSHFNFLPSSTVFRPEELHLILLSDIGIGMAAVGVWYASTKIGFAPVALLYLQPYMWVNHWRVAITYLHHTHPKVPKYEAEA